MTKPPRGPVQGTHVRHGLAMLAIIFALTSCATSTGPKTVAPDAKKASTALNAGLKAHASGQLTVASTDYQEALKYDHKNKFALYNLALIDVGNSNFGLAEDRYRVVLGLDPKYGPALFNLAILRTSRGDSKEAMALYQRAVANDPKAAAAWLNLGLLQRAKGLRRDGDKSVLTAIGLNPKLRDPGKAAAVKATPAKPAG